MIQCWGARAAFTDTDRYTRCSALRWEAEASYEAPDDVRGPNRTQETFTGSCDLVPSGIVRVPQA